MANRDLESLPFMLWADRQGRIYDHPRFRMAGFSGSSPVPLGAEDLKPMPDLSKLFFLPHCSPIGLDPSTGRYETVSQVQMDGRRKKCYAVSAFLEPGWVRGHLPAADYRRKSYILPMWAYCAVGFKDGQYWVSAFRVEYNHKWDPRNYDDRQLLPAIRAFVRSHGTGPLLKHLIQCATRNHCFAAKNLFLRRWEAPMPVSQTCNAACLGCLSMQPQNGCEPSHHRITFTPSRREIVSLSAGHLTSAPDPIVSFGQGCEGEPLTEYKLIAESIKEIREGTDRGTINLNTNGSWPDRLHHIAEAGLDSVRISLNSARPEFYRAYYQPKNYRFEDVLASITLCGKMGLYTMLNYLVFPGITDQEEEIDALRDLIQRTGISFIHFKNLNIDPHFYLDKMPRTKSKPIGMSNMVALLRREFPRVEFGYFNQPVR